ncbi:hypothetical protein SLEP1_g14049 [Rubroshorea leprosula]|uniref:Uncharacterized protein n=1 Tax=Rubroshorea leprosula TaxID=152421 RepID=A0AAV5INR4_9ROSI|nr:hypothetical protein SLEP1_g14049 [Rubroshorea leprosula]
MPLLQKSAPRQDQESCEGVLEGDPPTKTVTLPQLSLISIELTGTQANLNIRHFSEFKTDDPKLKQGLNECVALYGGIKENISQALRRSEAGDFKDSGELVHLSKKLAEERAASIPHLLELAEPARAMALSAMLQLL